MKRRNTPTKEAVLNVLKKANKAMSQDDIEQLISIDINRSTIYRVLNRFCDEGILHRIVAESGKQYFAMDAKADENNLSEHHFHFKCNKCGIIECLPGEVDFSVPKNYFVEDVNCVLTGTCNECA